MSATDAADEREQIFQRLREGVADEPADVDVEVAGDVVEQAENATAIAGESSPPAAEPFKPTAVTYEAVPNVVIPLAYPFTVEGQPRTNAIELRPPRLDFFQAEAAGRITRAEMIAEMAGVPVSVINAMRWPDAERVLAFAGDMAPDLTGE